MSGLFLGEIRLDPVDLDAYFARIGYSGPREPTVATLKALHHLHPAAIPFETLDVRMGLSIDLAPAAIDAKLITAGRGGYCFEQNTLFLRVLLTLGFNAAPLIARSKWRRPLDEFVARTHMAVRVQLDDGLWLADVGFGACMLTAPLRLDTQEVQSTRHEAARITPVNDELRVERLLDQVWTPLYDLVPTPQAPVDLLAANWLISTHPASSFRQRLVATRTRDDIRHVLVDSRLTTRHADGRTEHTHLNAKQLALSLQNDFGLPVQSNWLALFEEITAAA